MHRHDVPVDPIEAQEVVRLAAERQSSTPDNGPTVNGLAEALGLAPVEIERLLAEVRAQRAVTGERRRIFGDRSAALSAAIALVLFLVTGAFGLAFYQMRNAAASPDLALAAPPAPPDGIVIEVPRPEATIAPPDLEEAVAIDSEADQKREEIERLAREIAQYQAKESIADAERSAADLNRTINELRRELEALKKKASENR